MCGPGTEGQPALFTCPALTPVPACVWFDTAARSWSSAGCRGATVSATGVTCACSHLTDFAVRFAILEDAAADVFAIDAPGLAIESLAVSPLFFLALAALALGTAVGAGVARRADAAAAPRFARALAADPEIAFARRVEELLGREAVIDRVAPAEGARSAAGARRGRRAASGWCGGGGGGGGGAGARRGAGAAARRGGAKIAPASGVGESDSLWGSAEVRGGELVPWQAAGAATPRPAAPAARPPVTAAPRSPVSSATALRCCGARARSRSVLVCGFH
jgi:hypothetical protein